MTTPGTPAGSLKRRTLERVKSLAKGSGDPIETVLAKAVEAYKRQYEGKEGQEALRALAQVEEYQRQCVGKSNQETLGVLSSVLRAPTCKVLEKGLKAYSRPRLWDRADAAYTALGEDPEAWEREEQERLAWEVIVLPALAEQK